MQKVKGKGRTLDIAPQVDIATTKALAYMARTKQRRTSKVQYQHAHSCI